MSLIAPLVKSERQILSFRVDIRILALLKQYTEFIESPQDYVAAQALLVTFSKDAQFQAWLQEKAPENLAHLRALLAERQRGTSARDSKSSESQ